MSLVNGIMKLVCRENYPNKEALIDIPYVSWSHWQSTYNQNYPRLTNRQAHSNFEIIPKLLFSGDPIVAFCSQENNWTYYRMRLVRRGVNKRKNPHKYTLCHM